MRELRRGKEREGKGEESERVKEKTDKGAKEGEEG